MVRRIFVFCAAMATGLSALGSTIYWGGTSTDWTNGTSWVGGTVPKNGDTGIIASGAAQVNASGNLYNPGLGETPPAAILIQTNGTLNYNRWGQPSILDHNLVLDGGTFSVVVRLYSTCEYDHDIAVRSNSVIDSTQFSYSASWWSLLGRIKDFDASHTGRVTARMGNGNGFSLSGTNAPFTGGWLVTGAGTVQAASVGALGSGAIVATNAGVILWNTGGDSNMPSITVGNGCALWLGNNGHYSVAPGNAITLQSGSQFGTMWTGDGNYGVYMDAPLQVSGNVTFTLGYRRYTLYAMGDISNAVPATITINWADNSELYGVQIGRTNSSFWGDWNVVSAGLPVLADGALGTGAVELQNTRSLTISKSLKLYNMIRGNGPVGSAGLTLTLQPCYRNATLTPAGMMPGTNGGLVVGTLTAPGNLAFTNLPNYDGAGSTACCKVEVKFQDDPANPGYPINDLLAAVGNITGISSVDLVVDAQAGLPALQRAGPRSIMTAANSFTGQVFHSVTFNGPTGSVLCTNGAVKVSFSYPGPLVDNANGATNLTTQGACLNGTVTSTGTAPTHVWAYWGPTDGGTNAGNWANPPVDFGVCGIGLVSTNVSGLLPETAYYYRFYADNGNGTQWALASSKFVTLPDYTQYGYKMKIQFPGYTRGEVLTNFPALVEFSSSVPGFLYSHVKSGSGCDLRFSNANATKNLNYEIENWNTNGVSVVWVQMDVLAGSNDYIWAYYGNAAAAVTPATYATNGATWANGFVAVWHMGQTNTSDSTANNAPGASFGNTNAVGFVGVGQGFNGSSAYINESASGFANFANGLTVSLWANPSSAASWARFIDFGRGQGSDNILLARNGSTANLTLQVYSGSTAGNLVTLNNGLTLNTWQHLVATETAGGAVVLYTNGVQGTTGTTTVPVNIPRTQNYVGRSNWSGDSCYAGLIDELRIENVARSSNWVWAVYQNMALNSAFNAYQCQLASPLISNQGGVSNKTAYSADLNGYLSWTGSASTAVTVFYGKQDQYPNQTGWEGSVALGTQGVGSVLAHISGLTPNTNYVYRFYATNAFGGNWAVATAFSTPPDVVSVDNDGGASGVTAFQATLNGDLVATGGAPTAVWVFFGDAAHSGGSGNTDPFQWLTSYCFGNVPQGAFLSTNVYGLSPSTVYYYNFYASNILGTAWGVASNFITMPALDYADRASGVWNSTNTWTPATGYPSNVYDSATIVSNTVTATGGYAVPSIRYINITTNATGSKTGTFYYADATAQTAPLELNGGILKLDVNGASQAAGPVTVKSESQIYVIGQGNYANPNYCYMTGSVSDYVQGGVTNTGIVHLYGNYRAKVRYSGASSNFSGGWDIVGGAESPYRCAGFGGTGTGGGSGGMVLDRDGGLGTGTTTVRNRLVLTVDQTNAPAPARVVVMNGGELQLDNDWAQSPRYVSNWEIELQSGSTLSLGPNNIGAFTGGHVYMTGNSTLYGYRSGSSWGPDNRYGGQIVGGGRLTIDADRGGGGSQIFRLSGNNTNFSGGVTVLWNALYVENLNALGTGDCWFNSADVNGGVFLNTVPATTNWVLPNNFGGISNITVQTGSSNYVLTVPGTTVQIGTNVNVAGRLTVVGNLAFSTNAAGGLSTLIVDVMGTNGVAGVDYDRLTVTAGNATLAASLPNCALVVTTALPGSQLSGMAPITILTATNADFSAASFGSVVFHGAAGQVRYNNGNVQVQFYAVGTVLMVQ